MRRIVLGVALLVAFALTAGAQAQTSPPPPPPDQIVVGPLTRYCSTDLSQDHFIDTGDIGLLVSWFSRQGFPPAYDISPRLNPDGFIDTGDIGLVTAEFGRACIGSGAQPDNDGAAGEGSLDPTQLNCAFDFGFQAVGLYGPFPGEGVTFLEARGLKGLSQCSASPGGGGSFTSQCQFSLWELPPQGQVWFPSTLFAEGAGGKDCSAASNPNGTGFGDVAYLPCDHVHMAQMYHEVRQNGFLIHGPHSHWHEGYFFGWLPPCEWFGYPR